MKDSKTFTEGGSRAQLQHRAQKLAFWMMFAMSYPAFMNTSEFAVKASQNTMSLFIIRAIALLANVALIPKLYIKQ